MDRFIVDTISDIITDVADLKSNMDRFIDNRKIRRKRRNGFKIQYGQIYSFNLNCNVVLSDVI